MENIDKFFKDALYKKEMPVSDSVWNNIEKNLPSPTPKNSFRNKAFALGGLLTAALSVTLLVLNTNTHYTVSETIAQSETIENVDAQNVEFSEAERNLPNQLATVEDSNLKKSVQKKEQIEELPASEDVNTEEFTETEIEEIKTNTGTPRKYLPFSVYKKENKLYAKFNINNLRKNGALLVRLKTKSKTIAELKKRGLHKKAKEIEENVKKENRSIYTAFVNNFDFAPVYFFYVDDSDKIEAEKFDNVFVNANLEIDETIKMNQPFFLIADIGQVKDESGQTSALISRAIVLKDKEFDQLKAPFPYVQASSNEHRTPVHVGKLNKKLHSYYNLIQN